MEEREGGKGMGGRGRERVKDGREREGMCCEV
jgi:hypothetical protein